MSKLSMPVAALVGLVALSACNEEKSAPPPPVPSQKPVEGTVPNDGKNDAPMEMKMLTEGDPAPAVDMKLQDGTVVKLSEQKGLVFVYFYPKDDTPGCTVEAKGLRDNYAELQKHGVQVFGVSLQDADSHQAFIDKHELPFGLVVDDGTVARAFDVPVKGEYASRHSFLIKDGKVVKTWRKVSPAKHAEEVLAAAEKNKA